MSSPAGGGAVRIDRLASSALAVVVPTGWVVDESERVDGTWS